MASNAAVVTLTTMQDAAAEGRGMKPIKTYEITVQGFPPMLYSARSPSKARARCWRDYSVMDDRATKFCDFLKKSTIRRVSDPPGIGERILVAGEPATRVIGYGQYTHFMRDDSDVILLAHPSEVAPISVAAAGTRSAPKIGPGYAQDCS